jgi:hypothetical protein
MRGLQQLSCRLGAQNIAAAVGFDAPDRIQIATDESIRAAQAMKRGNVCRQVAAKPLKVKRGYANNRAHGQIRTRRLTPR